MTATSEDQTPRAHSYQGMQFEVGQRVAITRIWDRLETFGQSKVVKVSALKVVLADGSEWRASDGYAWGEKPCKHFGRAGQKHIRSVDTDRGSSH